jgi:hypothetical protein
MPQCRPKISGSRESRDYPEETEDKVKLETEAGHVVTGRRDS